MILLFSLIVTIFGIIGVIKSIKYNFDELFIISIFISSTFFIVLLSSLFPT